MIKSLALIVIMLMSGCATIAEADREMNKHRRTFHCYDHEELTHETK